MAKATQSEQYVLLPPRGLRARARTVGPETQEFLRSAHQVRGREGLVLAGGTIPGRIVDSIAPDGAKLVELTPQDALAVRAQYPSLRLVPVVYYTPQVVYPKEVTMPAVMRAMDATETSTDDITFQVISTGTRRPVVDAFVVAYLDFAAGVGAQAMTDANGMVTLSLGESPATLERFYVYPLDANWSIRKLRFKLRNGTRVALRPLDLGYTDGLRYFYGGRKTADDAGAGVTVGVVDTGIADHPDLVIAGGANTVPGEDPGDFGDNGRAHGTHVAGILAARGRPPRGLRGVAPGVKLMSYRVFPQESASASNFSIAKAIDQAIADKCDLINLSMGGDMPDVLLQAAIEDARAAGTVCIAASGNGDRGPVSFPANEDMCLAVSGMGRKGTFPTNAAAVDEIAAPYGTDKKNFLGRFSNVGPQLDLTAPGTGVMSTVPGGYAEISGTSMACPAATGAAARAIAGTDIVGMRRDSARWEAIVKAVLASAQSLGLGPEFEGHGMPRP